MTPWVLISTGYPVQTGDPVGTGEPLHRLEPVPVRPGVLVVEACAPMIEIELPLTTCVIASITKLTEPVRIFRDASCLFSGWVLRTLFGKRINPVTFYYKNTKT
jgi:hypothetical protein